MSTTIGLGSWKDGIHTGGADDGVDLTLQSVVTHNSILGQPLDSCKVHIDVRLLNRFHIRISVRQLAH